MANRSRLKLFWQRYCSSHHSKSKGVTDETDKGKSDSCELGQIRYSIYMLKKSRNSKNKIAAIHLLANRIKNIYLDGWIILTTWGERVCCSSKVVSKSIWHRGLKKFSALDYKISIPEVLGRRREPEPCSAHRGCLVQRTCFLPMHRIGGWCVHGQSRVLRLHPAFRGWVGGFWGMGTGTENFKTCWIASAEELTKQSATAVCPDFLMSVSKKQWEINTSFAASILYWSYI